MEQITPQNIEDQILYTDHKDIFVYQKPLIPTSDTIFLLKNNLCEITTRTEGNSVIKSWFEILSDVQICRNHTQIWYVNAHLWLKTHTTKIYNFR